ncbi:MAG: NAD(P)H-hydrate epimerase [Crocinitomix sp.]|nr:NAD(P)H-hydrate epimerase [Crocinitomix sp.]
MSYPEITVPQEEALSLDTFREMDYYAVAQYHLPIELMMESAGLNLALLTATKFPNLKTKILVGVGPGNNGGGGLVAARRLAAWGYEVQIDLLTEKLNELPALQLKRALKFGVKRYKNVIPDVIVDAYLGFSQRPPLRENLVQKLEAFNKMKAYRISLDLPTGLFDSDSQLFFNADTVLTLAAPKKILYHPQLVNMQLFVADLGIPSEVYEKFCVNFHLPFNKNSILKVNR